jgi:hypothetical protein
MAGLLDTHGIENFYDAAISNDFARKNLFRVINLGGQTFSTNELLYMTTLSLPGRSITNVPVPFMGLSFNVPGTAQYPNSNAWQVTFRVPQNLSVRRKLEDWSRRVFDDANSTGSYSIPSKDASNQVSICLLDKAGNPIRTYTLFGAYCVTVGDLALDISSAGELVEQQATLAYQYWRLQK